MRNSPKRYEPRHDATIMRSPTLTRRSFYPTPAWLIFGLLVVEGLLWLSERYRWFWFNERKGWTVLIAVAVVGGRILIMLIWFIASLLFAGGFNSRFGRCWCCGCRGPSVQLAGGRDEEGQGTARCRGGD